MRKCLRNTVFMVVRIYWLKNRSMCGFFLPIPSILKSLALLKRLHLFNFYSLLNLSLDSESTYFLTLYLLLTK